MADIIRGIPNKRLDRLKKHLLKLEKQTGKPLRRKPRGEPFECPIENFAPSKNRARDKFCGAGFMSVTYGLLHYKIYGFSDAAWWCNLAPEPSRQVTKYIMDWIKNREKK